MSTQVPEISTAGRVPVGSWEVDPKHSSIEFQVRSMGIATVKGFFREFKGWLEAAEDISQSKACGIVQAASLDTREEQRDEHLRSADFFDVENHPEIRFDATKIELGGTAVKVTGDFTVRGITKEIELDAYPQATAPDPWGNQRVGVHATGVISRSDFGMEQDERLENGAELFSDEVRLVLELAAVKKE
jgi:polyisoprenoid-binding protein YceI